MSDIFEILDGTAEEQKYLRVDDQGTYVDVICDGFTIRINSDSQHYIYDGNDVRIADLYHGYIYVSSTIYFIGYDSNVTLEVIENTPQRVVIRLVGNLHTGSVYLTNSTSFTEIITIYPDRVAFKIEWVTSGTVSVDNDNSNRMMTVTDYALTNPANIYENSGTESTGTSSVQNSADYIGVKSDELNIIGINLEHTDSSDFQQYLYNNGYVRFTWINNASFPAGTHTMTTMLIIDSADREYGIKKYTETERLEMGDQYKDTTLPMVGQIDDLNIPAKIGDNSFHSDGAWNLKAGSNRGRIENDITRNNSVYRFLDWKIRTGTLTDYEDHLVGHWPCNDNAASTTIVDVSGNGYDGTLTGGDNTEDKDSTDSPRGTSLLTNGTDDVLTFDTALSNLADSGEFTVQFKFKPNFAYNSTDEGLFSVWYDTNNDIWLWWDTSEGDYRFGGSVNSVSIGANIFAPNFTSDNDFQQWHTISIAVSLSKQTIFYIFDGVVQGIYTGVETAWANAPTNLDFGYSRDASSYGPFYFSDIKLYNGCLLPYGGGPFTGIEQATTAIAHSDLSFYWDCQSDSAKGGASLATTKTGTKSGNGTYVSGGILGNYYDNVDTSSDIVFTNTDNDIITGIQGWMGIWVDVQAGYTDDDYIFYARADNDNKIGISVDESAGNYRFFLRYEANNILEQAYTGYNWSSGLHYVEITWNPTEITIRVDGVIDSSAQPTDTVAGGFTGDIVDIYFGSGELGSYSNNCHIHAVYITNDPNTPDRWSVFGKPVFMPLVEKNGVYQQAGVGYQPTMGSDGTAIITDLGELV